ncbi:ABC transporter permease [Lihuaxuella thermophila]|uniref:ABC-2 type transport system permease protein n=1 Tax=Lihuaxuella thermophila TaxID=1173111 RepID=A0A1H8CBQ5_9BACL|nr:ABC transporter permease [Lihuaxuella thermophila]SEM92495.1 ABC-2 type transport system permease protein [Lihuaxuella thermophila]
MPNLWSLIRMENLKIFERSRTWVFFGALITCSFIIAWIMNWFGFLNAGRDDAWEFVWSSVQTLFLAKLLASVIAGDIVSSEFAWGTAKLLLIRPASRTKILFAKYMAVLIFVALCMILTLFSSFLFGAMFFGIRFDVQYVTPKWQDIGAVYGLFFVEIIMTATFAFMLSAISRSSSFSIGLSVFFILAGPAVVELCRMVGFDGGKYLLSANMNLRQYMEGNNPLFEGMSPGFSITVLLIYFFVFHLLSWISFTRRDIDV